MKHKNLLSALTAAVMSISLLQLPASAAVTASGTLRGDVNGDGEITVTDAVIYQGWLFGHDNVTILAPENADIDGDGKVNAKELTLVKRILLTGAEITPPDTPELTDGKLYSQIGLVDQYAGIVAYQGLLPEGWTVQMTSSWGLVNPYPGAESVQFVSPDGKAVVTIDSPLVFEEGSDRGYGADISNFITLQPYMNATTFIDNYIGQSLASAEPVADLEITAEEQADIDAITEVYATNGIQTAIENSRYQIIRYGAEGTLARRQFRVGTGYCECSCAISAYQYTYTKVMLNITETWWQILRSISYIAEDKEAFDKYYSDYEVIIANGYFTAAFYSAVSYVSKQIFNMMIEYRTEERIRELAGDYSSSGTTVTNSDMETQERVMQAWDDYIKDENAYSLGDGSTLHVPTSVDTVAQNGDSLYFGTPGSVPIGYDILIPN